MSSQLYVQMPYDLLAGDQIKLQAIPNKGLEVEYRIILKETETMVNDGSCTNYPTADHDSYTACIDAEMRERILPVFGCMVPWMGQSNSCQGPFERLPDHEGLLNWILVMVLNSMGGKQYTSEKCRLPCTILSVRSTYLQKAESWLRTSNAFVLYLSNDVSVQRIVLAYGLGDLLVEVGSCLGLWLGLSVVGIFDIIVLVVVRMKTFLEHW